MKNKKLCKIVDFLEKIFALVVVIGVFVFTVKSMFFLTSLDWQLAETFYEFINRVLIIVVGLELAKLLLTHDIYAISYLLAFIVARKMLYPELTSLDILLGIVAFSILFFINTGLINKRKND